MIDFRQVASLFIDNNEVSELWIDGNKVWEKSSGLTFTAEEANSTVAMTAVGSAPNVSLEYNTGNGWNDFIVGTTTVTLPNVGDKMYLRAKTTNTGMASSASDYNMFVMTGKIAASDSIMYLLKNDGDLSAIPSSQCFNQLFDYCSSLVTAPTLPATTLADYCYQNLFSNCTSLTKAPELPATTLASSCYRGMFYNCIALTSAPELSADTLAAQCYEYMFYGCNSLNSIKIGYTGTFSEAPTLAFNNWVNGVAASGTLYYDGKDTTTGNSAIPTGWTVIPFNLTFTSQMDGTTISMRANGSAPALDLEYTKDGSSWSDFTVGSTSVLIDEGEHASFRTKSTTDTVTSTGDADYNYFVVNGKATLSGLVSSMVNKDPFRAKLPEGSNYALNRLFNAQHGIVGSLKNFKLPFKKLEENCYKCMFRDSGGITEAPELPATELAPECYHAMFEICTGMTTPCSKLEATDVPYRAYYHMFSQCYNLASAPAISAVDVGEAGMESMFNLCSHLSSPIDLSSVEHVEDYGMKSIFNNCNVLPSVDVSNIKTVKFYALQSAFECCWNLTSVELTSLYNISGFALLKTFNECLKLKTIKFGPVTYVNPGQGTETFKRCWNLDTLDLADVKVAFGFAYPQGMDNSNFHVVVPDSLFNDFQTNWSSIYGNIVSETDYENDIDKYVDQTYTAPTQSEIEKGVLFVARRRESWIRVVKANPSAPTLGLEYSTDGTNWNDYTIGDILYFYNAGDKIWFRANQYGNPTWCEAEHDDYYNAFEMRGSIDAYGDVFMLLNQQGASYFNGEVPKRGFLKMFFGGQNYSFNTLKKAPDLSGIVRVNDASMRYMFKQCYGLSGKIDMSNLEYVGVVGCHECFSDAHLITEIEDFTSLTEVGNQGMRTMFYNTSITTAPELPATILNGGYCYSGMFQYCRKLTTPMSALPATSSPSDCYNAMFHNCRNLMTAPVLELVTPTTSSGDLLSMFQYCYCLESADFGDLTRIGNYCCRDTFAYCSNLKHVKLTNLSSAGTNQSNLRMFQYCRKLEDVDCSSAASVWTLNNTNAFDCNPYYKIYVPDNLYNSWRGASNWSSIASHIYPASTMPVAS